MALFRYFIPSAANFLAMIYCILLTYLHFFDDEGDNEQKKSISMFSSQRVHRSLATGLTACMGIMVAYAYPPVCISFLGLGALLFLGNVYYRRRVAALCLFLQGLLIFSILMLLRMPWAIADAYAQTPLLNSTLFAHNLPLKNVLILGGKPFLLQLVATLATWKNIHFRVWNISFLAIIACYALGLAVFGIGVTRFMIRGFGGIWMISLLTSYAYALGCLIGDSRIQRTMTTALLAFAILVPTYVFTGFGYKRIQDLEAYSIPEDMWNSYQWLWHNSKKNAVVAAFGEQSQYLVPIYTKNDLLFAQYGVSMRPYTTEVDAFMAGAKFFRIPAETISALTAASVASTHAVRTEGSPLRRDMFTRESAFFAHGLFYYPYNVLYQDVSIAENNGETTHSDFTAKWTAIYLATPLPEKLEHVDYLILDRFYFDYATIDPEKWEYVNGGPSIRLYKKIKD